MMFSAFDKVKERHFQVWFEKTFLISYQKLFILVNCWRQIFRIKLATFVTQCRLKTTAPKVLHGCVLKYVGMSWVTHPLNKWVMLKGIFLLPTAGWRGSSNSYGCEFRGCKGDSSGSTISLEGLECGPRPWLPVLVERCGSTWAVKWQ